jgi:hypothetical protein
VQSTSGDGVSDLDILSEKFRGKHVCVAGNGPTLNLFDQRAEGLVATVNSGLGYFDKIRRPVDLFWVQDRRMLIDKKDLVEPFLKNVHHVMFNDDISYFRIQNKTSYIPVRMLGYKGFSKDIELGLFHGYTAVFGLLQILYCMKVSSISLYGVGLNYFSGDPRFYQKERGIDVDLNRASEQVSMVRLALRQYEEAGIGVEIVGQSLLTRAS